MFRRFVVVAAVVILVVLTPNGVEPQVAGGGVVDGGVRTYEAQERTWGDLLSIWLTIQVDTAVKAG